MKARYEAIQEAGATPGERFPRPIEVSEMKKLLIASAAFPLLMLLGVSWLAVVAALYVQEELLAS